MCIQSIMLCKLHYVVHFASIYFPYMPFPYLYVEARHELRINHGKKKKKKKAKRGGK